MIIKIEIKKIIITQKLKIKRKKMKIPKIRFAVLVRWVYISNLCTLGVGGCNTRMLRYIDRVILVKHLITELEYIFRIYHVLDLNSNARCVDTFIFVKSDSNKINNVYISS